MTEEKALVAAPPPGATTPELDLETLRAAVSRGGQTLDNSQLKLAVAYASRVGADLISGQIIATVMDGRLTFISSIDFLRVIAERSGQYAGQGQPVYEEGECAIRGCPYAGHPIWAEASVYRLGWAHPLVRRAYWHEYVPQGGRDYTWKKMPHVMLAKVAEAAALRAAFPNDMGGLYVREEMEQAEPGQAPGQLPPHAAHVPDSYPDIPPEPDAPELPFVGVVGQVADGVRRVVRPDWCDWLEDKHVAKLELVIKVKNRKHTALILGELAYAVEDAGLQEGDRVAVDGQLHEYEWAAGKPKAKQVRRVQQVLVMRDGEWEAIAPVEAVDPPGGADAPSAAALSSTALEPETTIPVVEVEDDDPANAGTDLVEQAQAIFGDLPDEDVRPAVAPGGMGLPIWQPDRDEELEWEGGLISSEQMRTNGGKDIYVMWVTYAGGTSRVEVVMPALKAETQGVSFLGRGQVIAVRGKGASVGDRTVVLASEVKGA